VSTFTRLGLAAALAVTPMAAVVVPAGPAAASESCSMAYYGDLHAHYRTTIGAVTRHWYVAQAKRTFNASSPHKVTIDLRKGETRINDKRVTWSVGGSLEVSTSRWVKVFANVKGKIEGQYNRDVGSYLKEYTYNAVSATYKIPHGQTVWWQGGAKYTAPFTLRLCSRSAKDWQTIRKGTLRAHWSTVDPSVPALFQSTACGVAAPNALEAFVKRNYCVR